jgi:integral membrane protein (TIGR01906 family)
MPPKLTSLLATILTPIVLVGISLRLLLSPLFPQVEYRMPGFPEDDYGFTMEERLKWSTIAIEYLVNDADTSFLGDLKFDDGSPLYNERELSHMDDVKRVTKGVLNVFYLTLAGLTILGLYSRRREQWQAWLLGLRRGGLAIIWLAGAVAVVVLVGMFILPSLFWDFFTGFHKIFFEGDSWMFLTSDTLIRLFPLRFWQDTFLFAAGLSVLGAICLIVGVKRAA